MMAPNNNGRLELPTSIERAGRALLAEASIIHAKTVQLGIFLEQTLSDLIDEDGNYTLSRYKAGTAPEEYPKAIERMVTEIRDLAEWTDSSLRLHDVLDDVAAFAARLNDEGERYQEGLAARSAPSHGGGKVWR